MRPLALLSLLVLLTGCPSALPSRQDGGEDAGADGGGELAVEELELTVSALFPDGGSAVLTFDPAGPRPEVESTQELELATSLPLQNYRVRVYDESERPVVSDDTADEGADGLRYRIRFPEPLKTGYRYALIIDGQTGATALDGRGQPVPEQRLEFSVAGERQKPAPPPSKKRGKRRR